MPQEKQTPFEIVTLALAEAHHLGKTGGTPSVRFHAENATRALFSDLAEAGAVICPETGDEPTLRSLKIALDQAKLDLLRVRLTKEQAPHAAPVPEGIANVSVATDASHGGAHVCVLGWNEDGTKGWLLNHVFVPSLRADA